MRKAAARLSAEMPVRNAATRSGEAIFGSDGVAPSVFAIAAPDIFCELESAGIDLAARSPRQFERVGDGILDAVRGQLRAQELVERLRRHHVSIGRGRSDHQHEFAAGLQSGSVAREL